MNTDNIDFGVIFQAVAALAAAAVGLGVVISRYTKTDADDKFFAKLAKAFGLKSLE